MRKPHFIALMPSTVSNGGTLPCSTPIPLLCGCSSVTFVWARDGLLHPPSLPPPSLHKLAAPTTNLMPPPSPHCGLVLYGAPDLSRPPGSAPAAFADATSVLSSPTGLRPSPTPPPVLGVPLSAAAAVLTLLRPTYTSHALTSPNPPRPDCC